MWRFALRLEDATRCSRPRLLKEGVAEDFDFSDVVEAFERGEVVFAVTSGHPADFEDALRRVRDLCGSEPTRIWLANEQIHPDFFNVHKEDG
jgi:hypothetical protein